MTQVEERALLQRLRSAESSLHQALSGIGLVVNHYLTLGNQIAAGHERLDRFVMERDIKDRNEYRALLSSLCEQVRAGVAECSRHYEDVMLVEPGCHAASQHLLDASLARLQQLLPSFCFKHRVNTDLVPGLMKLLDEVSRVEARVQNTPGQPGLICELERIQRLVWMDLRQFRRRVDEVRRADEEANAAKQKLVEGHLWLVIMIAREYTSQGMSGLDLIQEGNLGLMRAAEMCVRESECRFGSYASWWIRQAITRGIADQGRLIRLPSYLHAIAGTMLRLQRQLTMDFGYEPTAEVIAEELHMSASRVRSIMGIFQPPVSLQSKVGEESDAAELGDFVEDTRADPPGQVAGLNALGDKLHQLLSALTEQERYVITKRYGLSDDTSQTLEEVGRQVNLCRQRVQQIEAKAMKKLRHPARLRVLHRLLGG